MHHSFTKTLKAKGSFCYCSKCGLILLGNKATQKAVQKPCVGLRELEDAEYLRVKKMVKGG